MEATVRVVLNFTVRTGQDQSIEDAVAEQLGKGIGIGAITDVEITTSSMTDKCLLQVAIYRKDGPTAHYIETVEEMKEALAGSRYVLNEKETAVNDGIAMITTPTEAEATKLMELGEFDLCNGYYFEIPRP